MTAERVSSIWDVMEAAGGVSADYHGRRLMRHFGDPAGSYEAATSGAVVFDRSHRSRLVVAGRAPGQMLDGILTGRMPTAPAQVDEQVLSGEATYHAVLTPKGRMISDVWAMLRGDEESAGFLLDVPVAGSVALLENFKKFLPPRLASVEDVSDVTAMISVVGPEAATLLSRLALGLRVGSGDLSSMDEGEWRMTGESVSEGLAVIKSKEVWPSAYSVVGPAAAVAALWRAVVSAGAHPAGHGVWSTLRVEGGRPVFGTDMDDTTIPIEAGVHDRAIDYDKGCYTGQEVIIRIRDRGHVNRHLRQLRLGNVPTPAKGTELLAHDSTKVVGQITSAVQSPKYEETLALAYVRRGVESVVLDGRLIAVPAADD